MSVSRNWKVLDLHLKYAPKLVARSRFDASGYYIELSDLSRIWAEKLSKEEIIQRASDISSSIDPTEDDEQFTIFLQKIESAINCEDGTSLNIQGGEVDGARLNIHLSAPLPHPLPPFSWMIQLKRLSDNNVEAELVTPLLRHASSLKQQIQHLIEELHDKDRVISKICDRLETSGNDLTIVFPSQAKIKLSRKHSQRGQLAKHVHGLGDFDEDVWRDRTSKATGLQTLDSNVMDVVFRDLPPLDDRNAVVGFEGAWWQESGGDALASAHSLAAHDDGTSQRLVSNGEHGLENESMQQDEFQRQPTPPLLKQPVSGHDGRHASEEPLDIVMHEDEPHTHPDIAADDESTTDDEGDDLDAPSTIRSPIQKVPPMTTSPKKLGTIGGHSWGSPSSSTKVSASEAPPIESKPRSKLGTIGGQATASAPLPTSSNPDKSLSALRPAWRESSKMGVIGEKKASDIHRAAVSPVEDVGSPGSANEQRQTRQSEKKEASVIRETSQQRADKKRDQLKRDLEEKAKAPSKKKRKF